jgi:prepilin-type N-terminal cleavage/methylation domain-containing protein
VRARAGFTIVEVLVAMTLMAIALSGITMTGIVSVRADTRSHRASVAAALAQAKLEQLRNTERDAADWLEGPHSEPSLDEHGASVTGGTYSREWEVVPGYNGHAGLARVTVRVSWAGEGSGAVTLSSLYW